MANRGHSNPQWFILSYDASQKLYDLISEGATVPQILARLKREDDFREDILVTLKTKNVTEVFQPVKSTIYFLDSSNEDVLDRLDYWKDEFDKYGKDEFHYTIAVVMHFHSTVIPIKAENPDLDLNDSLQRIFI